MSSYIFQAQSIVILFIYFYGLKNSKNRNKHPKIMMTGFIWDIILILQIELSRKAIATAIKPMYNHMMLNIHISLAVTTVVLFVIAIVFGKRVLNGNNYILNKHRLIGRLAILLRVLTFLTSFFTVIKVK